MYRWTDPVMGPRTIPDLKNPLSGLTLVSGDQTFNINTKDNKVKIGELEVQQSGLIFRVSD